MNIEPNSAESPDQRLELLYELKLELLKHLKAGNYPARAAVSKTEQERIYSVKETLEAALAAKLKMKLSPQYKSDLQLICKQFLEFLTIETSSMPFVSLRVAILEEFLSKFSSSGTYYMKKRSDLSILFSLGAKLTNTASVARNTHTERSKATLHKAYDKAKMKALLNFIKKKSPPLYLCCLLTYGCWLRPHVEVLSLTKRQFKNNCTEIHLAGKENKGGKIRVVYVPDYVRKDLEPLLSDLEPDTNIFSGGNGVLNKHFFTTKWKRLRSTLIKDKLIEDGQTIYSFRHSAAIEIYKRTKDIYLLQKLMGHGSIGVTQKYLRSLGQVDIDELKNAAPSL